MGGSSSNGQGGVESPNSLVSDSLLKVTDLLCEGPIAGWWPQSGAYGTDPLVSTYLNNVPIRNLDGSYNFNVSGQGFAFVYTLGTNGQLPMTGFEHVTCQIPLPPDTKLSNPPSNAGLPKQLIVTLNTQQYPDADSILVNFRIPQMYTADSHGNTNGFEVDAQVDVSLNGMPFSGLGNNLQFIGKNTSPYFRTYQFTLPKTTPVSAFYQWTLRLYKTSTDIQSVQTANDIYVDSISVISASQYSYPNSALAGLYIDALQFPATPSRAYLIKGLQIAVPSGYTPTQYNAPLTFTRNCDVESGNNNVGMINLGSQELAGIFTGMAVSGSGIQPGSVVESTQDNGPSDYSLFSMHLKPTGGNGPAGELITFFSGNAPIVPATYPTVWDGTFTTGTWTDNPAWVFYDMCTNPRYGLGKYINTNNLDIWTLYQVSQYCDQMVDAGLGNGTQEPQFTCNAFIDKPEDAWNMLLNLASTFRGMLYYGNGTVRANTTDNQSPVFNYTNANVIGGVFNYASTARSARHNSIQVKYTDPNNLYRDNYVQVQDNQGIIQYGLNEKQISAFGCASIGQATRVANWILATERLRTETVTFQAGEDALYVRPGDVFNLYDNFRMNRSQGGRVQSFDTGQQYITLDRPVNLDSGVIYALTCLVPVFNYDTTTGVTGSTQIPQIRNPQIQSRVVLNANQSGITTIQVSGAGYSGLALNAVWILSATGVYTSGYIPTVFQQAPQYECLSVVQASPGIYDIAALKYNTGINYTVNTGFTTVMNPPNVGNSAAPLPVTNFTGHVITGALINNSFYSYFNLTWSASASSTVAGYVVSGDDGTPTFSQLGFTTSTGFQYVSPDTGVVNFKCVAVGKGGARSAPQSMSFNFPAPVGVMQSGIRFWYLPAGFGDLEQVSVLYNRPSADTTSTNVYYSSGSSGPFKLVLDMDVYPVQATIQSGLSSSGTTVYLQTASFDAATTLVSQDGIPISQSPLGMLIDDEVFQVGGITGLGNGQYACVVDRGQYSTFAVAHSGSISGWAFYFADLNQFTDATLLSVFNATGYTTGTATRYFQIQNQTAVLDGQIVPAGGIPWVIPNPTPGSPNTLTASTPGGPIVRLSWIAPTSTDIIEYRVYRATSPFATFTQIATETSATYYDDISVTLGNTYEYYVTAVAQNEQESSKSNTVTAIPPASSTSGINPYPPADPVAITLLSSGNYFAADGTLLAYMAFTVPGQPSGAAYTNLYYQRHGQGSPTLSGALIGGQTSNTQSSSGTIFDLSPNVSYDFGSQAISNYGNFSYDIVKANNSPLTTPFFTPTAGQPGAAPGAPSGFMVSGGLNGTADYMALSWQPNGEPNFEEYGLYRNSTNSQPANPFAYVASNSFIDAGVTGGITYYYWVSAFNRSETQSAITGPQSGSTLNGPATGTPPQPVSSGFYFSSDGNAFSEFTFLVLGLPSGAVGQYMLYRRNGKADWLVGNDLSNKTNVNATINDLTPSQLYDFGVQAYTINGIPGGIVTMTGIPFQAPSPNTAPNPPTSVSTVATSAGDATPLYYTASGPINLIAPASTVKFTLSTSLNIAYYEAYLNNTTPPDSPVPATPYQSPSDHFIPANVNTFIQYANAPSVFGYHLYLRAVDRNGNASSWVDCGTPDYGQTYAGNLGGQDSSQVMVTQVQIGASAATATRLRQSQYFYAAATVSGVGGSPASQADAYFHFPASMFTGWAPVGFVDLDAGTHAGQYRQGGSTSATAKIRVWSIAGTADINDGDTFSASMHYVQTGG